MIASDPRDWCAYAERAWADDKLGRVDDMERDLFAARERGMEEREILNSADQLAGRDRWTELATRLEALGALDKAKAAGAREGFAEKPTDERFALIFAATTPTRPATGC